MANDPNPAAAPQAIAPAASSTEATNARMLNQTIGKLIEASGGSAADLVTALNSIASAITASLIGGSTGATADRVLISKGTAGRALQASQVALAPADTGFAASAVAFTATQRVLGRNTASAGLGEEVTVTQILDWLSGAAQGDVIYRGASSWDNLAAGTNGQFLQTQGSGANPQWAGPTTTIQSGSLTGAAVNITSIPSYFGRLELHIEGMSFDTASRGLLVQVSTDNGSSYDTTAGNYTVFSFTSQVAVASLVPNVTHTLAASTENIQLSITSYQAGYAKGYGVHNVVGVGQTIAYSMYDGSTSAINAIQLLLDGSGNFDAGTYALIGVY